MQTGLAIAGPPGCRTAVDPRHAWNVRPSVFLSAFAQADRKPEQTYRAARLGLALQALAVELKAASAALLKLIMLPEYQGAAINATLRAATLHCQHVHKVEVLPWVIRFLERSGARPDAWRRALERRRPARKQPGTGVGDGLAAAAQTGSSQRRPALLSEDQEALLRSLDAAAALGVAEAAELSGHLAGSLHECERLSKRAAVASDIVVSGPSASVDGDAADELGDTWIDDLYTQSDADNDVVACGPALSAVPLNSHHSAHMVGAWDWAPMAQMWAEVSPPTAPPSGPWLIAHGEGINALAQAPPTAPIVRRPAPPQHPTPVRVGVKQVSKPTPPRQTSQRPALPRSPVTTSAGGHRPLQANPVKPIGHTPKQVPAKQSPPRYVRPMSCPQCGRRRASGVRSAHGS
jgi:hypothetical protein